MDRTTLADAAAASSLYVWLLSHALDFMPILQAFSLIAVIVSGMSAAYYHIFIAGKAKK